MCVMVYSIFTFHCKASFCPVRILCSSPFIAIYVLFLSTTTLSVLSHDGYKMEMCCHCLNFHNNSVLGGRRWKTLVQFLLDQWSFSHERSMCHGSCQGFYKYFTHCKTLQKVVDRNTPPICGHSEYGNK